MRHQNVFMPVCEDNSGYILPSGPLAFNSISLRTKREIMMIKAGWLEHTSKGEDLVNATTLVNV